MLGPDSSDHFGSAENTLRRKSMPFESIWSTHPARDSVRDQQLTIDSTSSSDSPARPPPTPLPQHSPYVDTGGYFHGGMARASAGYGATGYFRDPYPAGLGLVDVCVPQHTSQRFRETFSYQGISQNQQNQGGQQNQQTPQSQQAQQSQMGQEYWHDASDWAHSPNIYTSSQMAFPSTPNFSSQNVSPNLQQVTDSPFNYSVQFPVPPGFERHSAHSGSPVYGSVDREHIEPSLLESFANLQLNSQTHENPYGSEHAMHMRRHSFGDAMRPRGSKTTGTPRLDTGESNWVAQKVNQYFTRDPHERVKINYDAVCERLEHEREVLAPQYRLADFHFEEYLCGCKLVFVAFKAGRLDVFYIPLERPELQFLHVDDLVIVEADRGEDLGKVARVNVSVDEARVLRMLTLLELQCAFTDRSTKDLPLTELQHDSRSGSAGHFQTGPKILDNPKAVSALANQSQIGEIWTKRQEEGRACRVPFEKIADAMGSNRRGEKTESSPPLNVEELKQMEIIDAEYQFDHKKLTYYYSSPRRLDFRGLVKELFKNYKTRIWLTPVEGIPYRTRSTDRRHSQTSRMESIRGRPGYIRDRSAGRFSAPQVQYSNLPAESETRQFPEGSLPPIFSRDPTQE